MRIIELEPQKYLRAWLKEFDEAKENVITMPHIPYSYPAIRRELSRRQFVNDVLREQWIQAHKITPCPICGKSWSKHGRGMTYKSSKAHVLKCEGE